ncbi:NUDIX hydrolase [Kribbella sp. VKM Ac-2568]|uniref:NUDIX hydrolase n=1 Tax=Kribbella sp. VKM Ac-2568 TaxID=2512219 RepID=UPI0010509A22
MVRERYEHWNTGYWNLPSVALEPGESPEVAAIRELHEEAGLIVTADQLTLIAKVHLISQDHGHHSTAWNYRADIPTGDFHIADPSIQEARWFPVPDAIAQLATLPFHPLQPRPRSSPAETGWWRSGDRSTGHVVRTRSNRPAAGPRVQNGARIERRKPPATGRGRAPAAPRAYVILSVDRDP